MVVWVWWLVWLDEGMWVVVGGVLKWDMVVWVGVLCVLVGLEIGMGLF